MESIRARARHSSPSLLFCMVERIEWIYTMLVSFTLPFDVSLYGIFLCSTCLSVSLAGECGRRGVECPELGGEGDANVEEVMEGVM